VQGLEQEELEVEQQVQGVKEASSRLEFQLEGGLPLKVCLKFDDKMVHISFIFLFFLNQNQNLP